MTSQTKIIESTLKKESGRLFNFIKRYVPSKEDAEDILQDVFYQFIAGFEEIIMIDRISGWLFKSARNKIIDKSRKKKPENFSKFETANDDDGSEYFSFAELLPSLDFTPEDLFLRDEFNEKLKEALDELPVTQKNIFIMNEVDGFTFKEISEITGLNVNTLLSRKHYAVNQLRKKISQYLNK
ncbi:MAG: sigma-70 family RNA polymerase sigma factor [Ignavibacteriaceae bacterium]